jgi:hypothetical protein
MAYVNYGFNQEQVKETEKAAVNYLVKTNESIKAASLPNRNYLQSKKVDKNTRLA